MTRVRSYQSWTTKQPQRLKIAWNDNLEIQNDYEEWPQRDAIDPKMFPQSQCFVSWDEKRTCHKSVWEQMISHVSFASSSSFAWLCGVSYSEKCLFLSKDANYSWMFVMIWCSAKIIQFQEISFCDLYTEWLIVKRKDFFPQEWHLKQSEISLSVYMSADSKVPW